MLHPRGFGEMAICLSGGALLLFGVLSALLAAGAAAAPLPAPEDLPPDVIAVVSHVSDARGTITKHELHHALAQEAAFARRTSTPKPGEPGYERLKVRALAERLETAWILGQGAEMKIRVTARQVARAVARIKNLSFDNGAEYRRFLRRSHLTRRDLNERVRVQLVATRIQRRIVNSAAGQNDERKAFKEFTREFQERWRARTVCAANYVIEQCSNSEADALAAQARLGDAAAPMRGMRRIKQHSAASRRASRSLRRARGARRTPRRGPISAR
jgi:hypothetical protein